MATCDPTTPAPLPAARTIPYILEPRELDALLAIGEHLANISARLTALMGEPADLNRNARRLADELIAFLDAEDGDPDLEEGGDLEPNLAGSHSDLEGDTADWEPSLGWLLDGRVLGGIADYEDDIADRLHDAEPDEHSRQPARLDAVLAGEAAHV